MCNWFSFISFKGKFYYFSQKQREEINKDNIDKLEFDSHASIAKYFLHKNEKEDKSNKYEYNFFEDKFKIDQINDLVDDSKKAEEWVKELFKKEFLYCKKAKKEIDRIKKIQWFKPIDKIDTKKLQVKADIITKAFGLNFSVSLEVNSLETSAAESAARSAARSAAWSAAESAAESAAWSAAWSAAESAAESAVESAGLELSSDLIKDKYKLNPFKLLMDLWKQGFYVCGIVDKKFILYYVPKNKKVK